MNVQYILKKLYSELLGQQQNNYQIHPPPQTYKFVTPPGHERLANWRSSLRFQQSPKKPKLPQNTKQK